MSDVKVDVDSFFSEGGSELAAMSTTDSLEVAKAFAKSESPLIFRLGREHICMGFLWEEGLYAWGTWQYGVHCKRWYM